LARCLDADENALALTYSVPQIAAMLGYAAR
jgi:hypothetical protein